MTVPAQIIANFVMLGVLPYAVVYVAFERGVTSVFASKKHVGGESANVEIRIDNCDER
jgi:hypothetical protein